MALPRSKEVASGYFGREIPMLTLSLSCASHSREAVGAAIAYLSRPQERGFCKDESECSKKKLISMTMQEVSD